MKVAERGTPPWGKWMVLDEVKNYKAKRIEVHPGERLSYQKHFKRREDWRVVQGEGKVTLEGDEIPDREWEDGEIPSEAAHRIENTGRGHLVFIEVQYGDYLGENDIIRLEDGYGRVG